MSVLLIGLCLALPSSPVRSAEDGWVRTSSIHLPGLEPRDAEGDKTVVSVRLLREDGAGGYVGRAFVPHGVTTYHSEESHPTATRSRLLARGEGDEWGFVNVVKPEEPGAVWESGFHWHFEAKGHGGRHECGRFESFGDGEITLPGGKDREVLVIDPFGRTLTGARVSFFLGCPHSPALRSGVTDRRGIVALANLPVDRDEDFWVESPGVDRGPYALTPPRVGQPRPTILLDTARTARGRVVDEADTPLAGVVVRTTGYPRGPIALTDESGDFVLDGLPRGMPIWFYRPGQPYPDCIVSDFEESVPLRVTLRIGRPTSLTDGEERHLVTVITRREASVVLSRFSDGFTLRGKTESGLFRTEVPAGRYRIEAGGGFSMCRANAVECDLPRPGAETVQVPVTWDQVSLFAKKPGGWRAGLTRALEMHIPGRTRDISGWLNPSLPHRPPGVPTGLLVSNPPRILPVEGDHVELPPVPLNEIRFRVQDAKGSPAEVKYVDLNGEEITPVSRGNGEYLIRTWACGRTLVTFFEPFPDWKVVEAVLPTEKPGRVDLGTLIVPDDEAGESPGPWTFRLRYADGTPVTGRDQVWLSIIAEREPDSADWESLGIDEQGRIEVENGQLSIRIQIQATRIYPFAATVDRDGPREIHLPAGRITGAITGSDGKPVEAALFIDSYRFDAPEGTIDIHALPAGPHIVIAGAEGHLTEIRRIVLKDGETRNVEVRLQAR